jgi:hypothetical protein
MRHGRRVGERRNSLDVPTVVHRLRIQPIAQVLGLRLPDGGTDVRLPLFRRRGLVHVRVTRHLRMVLFRVVSILPKRRFGNSFLVLVVDQRRNTLQIDSSLRGGIQRRRRCDVIRELGLIRFHWVGL